MFFLQRRIFRGDDDYGLRLIIIAMILIIIAMTLLVLKNYLM